MVLWEALVVHHEYEQYKESHHMPAVNQPYMVSSTVWGTNIPGTPTVDSTVRDGVSKAPYIVALNTGSAEINGQLVAQAKSAYYQDWPVSPYKKWIPASPPQPAPGFGAGNFTDMATLDPRVPYADVSMAMEHNPWLVLRHHTIRISLDT